MVHLVHQFLFFFFPRYCHSIDFIFCISDEHILHLDHLTEKMWIPSFKIACKYLSITMVCSPL